LRRIGLLGIFEPEGKATAAPLQSETAFHDNTQGCHKTSIFEFPDIFFSNFLDILSLSIFAASPLEEARIIFSAALRFPLTFLFLSGFTLTFP